MKIQDIPQVGKLGLTVTWPDRNGLIRRILVTPKNPRTDRQLEVRELLSKQTRRFDALTDAQQDAWNVAAAGHCLSRAWGGCRADGSAGIGAPGELSLRSGLTKHVGGRTVRQHEPMDFRLHQSPTSGA